MTFLLPWLYFKENFDLLIKTEDLKTYTATAQEIINQRQLIIAYSPLIILGISLLCFLFGIGLCIKGISGWYREETAKQQASEISSKLVTQETLIYSPPEKTTSEAKEKLIEDERTILSSVEIPINNLWILNHWGSNVASIENGKMIFKGEKTRLETDGSHINLANALKIGSVYQITCFAKAHPNTTGKFQLWCHDWIETADPHGSEAAIPFATPTMEGEVNYLRFEAKVNSNLRIHLQYLPGKGQIEVSDVRIAELKIP